MFLKRLNLWEMFGSYNLPSPSWGLLLYEQSGCILRTAVNADVGVSYLVHRTQSLLTEAALWSFSYNFFLCREHEGKDTNTTSWARAKEPALAGVFSKGGGRDFHSLWNSRCLLVFKTSFPRSEGLTSKAVYPLIMWIHPCFHIFLRIWKDLLRFWLFRHVTKKFLPQLQDLLVDVTLPLLTFLGL